MSEGHTERRSSRTDEDDHSDQYDTGAETDSESDSDRSEVFYTPANSNFPTREPSTDSNHLDQHLVSGASDWMIRDENQGPSRTSAETEAVLREEESLEQESEQSKKKRKKKTPSAAKERSLSHQRRMGALSVRLVYTDDSEDQLESDSKTVSRSSTKRKHNCYSCGVVFGTVLSVSNVHARCYNCQRKERISNEAVGKHARELQELESNIRLNNNGWCAGMPDHYEGKALDMSSEAYECEARSAQTLPLDDELWWERIVEDLGEDPEAWEIEGRSRSEQKAKYWSRGRSLVAGGMAWTVEEGDLFFQGLRRFGKHNVWAIQEHIRTRSLAEVVTMIQTMEVELARRKYFGLKMIRMSEMPMAEEADEEQIELEEKCADALMDRETVANWATLKKQKDEGKKTLEWTDAHEMFRLKSLVKQLAHLDETSLGVADALYDSLKEFLTPIIKELIELHYERQRVHLILDKSPQKSSRYLSWDISGQDVLRTLYAQRRPIYMAAFFDETVRERLNSKDSEKWQLDPEIEAALSTDHEQSEPAYSGSEDSDGQPEETYEGSEIEAKIPSKRKRPVDHDVGHANDTESQSQPMEVDETLAPPPPKKTRQSSTVLPTGIPPLDISRPITTGNPRLDRAQNLRDSFLEREQPSWAQSMEDKVGVKDPERLWFYQVQLYEELMENKADVPPQVRLEDVSAPGYGLLPNNASFMHDVTRAPPKNGYGLGKRDQGGLWLMDKIPSELFHDDGYITVSDTEDEEEEELGWQRQMRADERIEKLSSRD